MPLIFSYLQHSEPDVFNTFLHEMKADLMGTCYSAFWSVNMVSEGVTLVDSSQCAASAVSAEEAAKVRGCGVLFSCGD